MKVVRRSLILIAVAYAIQLGFALFYELQPIEIRSYAGNTYVIRQGYGFPTSLVPGIGAMGFHPEVAVWLGIYDSVGRKQLERAFDMKIDVYEAYPSVWPEKQKRLTNRHSQRR